MQNLGFLVYLLLKGRYLMMVLNIYWRMASGVPERHFSLGGHKLVRHCYENFNALALLSWVCGLRLPWVVCGISYK